MGLYLRSQESLVMSVKSSGKTCSHAVESPFLARDSIYAIARYMPSPVRPSVRPSVCLSVTRVDQSKTFEVRITQPSPQSSPMTLSFLTRNGTLKFQREDREPGRQIREGYEKNAISATAGIVFRFTRRRCYRALTVALAGLSCICRYASAFKKTK